VASATEIARAKRSIFRSSHRDIAHSPAPGPHFSAARFGVRPLQTRAPLRAGLRIRGLTVQLQWQCVGLVRPFYDRLRAARWHIERVLLCSSSPPPPSPPAEKATTAHKGHKVISEPLFVQKIAARRNYAVLGNGNVRPRRARERPPGTLIHRIGCNDAMNQSISSTPNCACSMPVLQQRSTENVRYEISRRRPRRRQENSRARPRYLCLQHARDKRRVHRGPVQRPRRSTCCSG